LAVRVLSTNELAGNQPIIINKNTQKPSPKNFGCRIRVLKAMAKAEHGKGTPFLLFKFSFQREQENSLQTGLFTTQSGQGLQERY